MTWVRWIPGKWHRATAAPQWAVLKIGAGAMQTLCGKILREPDRVNDSPIGTRCQRCIDLMAAGKAAA